MPEARVIPLRPDDDEPYVPPTTPPGWEEQLAGGLEFLRRRMTGEYETDEFGFDPDLTDHVLLPLLRPLFHRWFRVESQGMENVPTQGGALVVANHSGTVPVDALMTTVALHDQHPAERRLRLLGADLVFDLPFIGSMSRKMGSTLACNEDAERLLTEGELVGVFPEGFKGIGKPFRERYTLQRFGRGGFVTAALRTGKPIIPCAIVGAEEIFPMIGNAKTAARVMGLPYFPITPTFPLLGPLGLVPLPSKWLIAFGEPIETASYGPAAAEDPMLVFNLTDQVRETIQHSLYQLLLQRKSVFGWKATRTLCADANFACNWASRTPSAPFCRPDASRERRVGPYQGNFLAGAVRSRRPPRRRTARRRHGGQPYFAALRPVRKSRICHPRLRAIARSSVSGLTATAVPVSESIGRSLAESL